MIVIIARFQLLATTDHADVGESQSYHAYYGPVNACASAKCVIFSNGFLRFGAIPVFEKQWSKTHKTRCNGIYTVSYKTKFGSQNFGYQIWCCTRLFVLSISNNPKALKLIEAVICDVIWSSYSHREWYVYMLANPFDVSTKWSPFCRQIKCISWQVFFFISNFTAFSHKRTVVKKQHWFGAGKCQAITWNNDNIVDWPITIPL